MTTPVAPATGLDAIREREQAADPGPWTIRDEHGRDFTDEGWSCTTILSALPGESANPYDRHNEVAEILGDDKAGGSQRYEANAAFIAAARTDVPALLAEVERLRRIVKIVTELTHDTDGVDLGPDTDIPVGEVMRALAGESA